MYLFHILLIMMVLFISWSQTAPTTITTTTTSPPSKNGKNTMDKRQPKTLYYDYPATAEIAGEYNHYHLDNDYLDEDNDLSRTMPTRKRIRPLPTTFNSPIYYIRLPPQPYMYVPGLGYISQAAAGPPTPPPPPPPPVSPFVNLPISFISNGKPSTIYQWTGHGLDDGFTTTASQKPSSIRDSTIHRLSGHYAFNGKPDDIFVLRDSYNSLYSDALQNFYP